MGTKQIDFFFESEDPALSIKTAPDIFTLKARQEASHLTKLENIDGFGKVSVKKLFDAIDARREIDLHRLIFALGIRHVGETTAKLLARSYGTYEHFEEAMKAAADPASDARAELNSIDGIGEVVARAIIEFYKEPRNLDVIDRLIRELRPKEAEKPSTEGSPVAGKTVVFTGSLENSRATRPRPVRKVWAPRWPVPYRRRRIFWWPGRGRFQACQGGGAGRSDHGRGRVAGADRWLKHRHRLVVSRRYGSHPETGTGHG